MLLPTSLRDALLTVVPFNDEAGAIAAWTAAWVQYMGQAGAGVPVNALALEGAPAAAMRAALVGMSTQDAGANIIQAGITAFWGAMAASPIAYFAAATIITPPPSLGMIAENIRGIFETNTRGNLPQAEALMNLAVALHTSNQGGSATFAAPPPVPIV